VPMSLVPIASIGQMLGVPTPTMRAVIHLACTMHGVDYWAEGRTVQRLGIAGMSVKDIRFLVVGAESAAPGSSPPPKQRPADDESREEESKKTWARIHDGAFTYED